MESYAGRTHDSCGVARSVTKSLYKGAGCEDGEIESGEHELSSGGVDGKPKRKESYGGDPQAASYDGNIGSSSSFPIGIGSSIWFTMTGKQVLISVQHRIS